MVIVLKKHLKFTRLAILAICKSPLSPVFPIMVQSPWGTDSSEYQIEPLCLDCRFASEIVGTHTAKSIKDDL